MAEAKSEIRNSKLASTRNSVVNDFTDLKAWQLARDLRQEVYRIARNLPPDERHVLSSQARRAAVSVAVNIAEGFGRFSCQENMQFRRQERGSALEVRDRLIAARDAGYIAHQDWEKAYALAQRAIQALNGYIRSTREMQKRREKT